MSWAVDLLRSLIASEKPGRSQPQLKPILHSKHSSCYLPSSRTDHEIQQDPLEEFMVGEGAGRWARAAGGVINSSP